MGFGKSNYMKLNFVCVSLNPALSCMHSSCYPVARSAPTRPKWVWSAPAALLSVRVPFPSTPWKSACQHLGRTGRINRNRSRVVEWVARLSGGMALRNAYGCTGKNGRCNRLQPLKFNKKIYTKSVLWKLRKYLRTI